jgi:8-oxo-dGTP pyrophosphatase MutT (NUDIX family)
MEALSPPLPGREAQMLMAPGYRQARESAASEGFRQASVLILLHPLDASLGFPLIRRPETMRHHGGQIALPGGAVEAGESYRGAALRELREELGIGLDESSIVGELSPLEVPRSGFTIHPFVAYMDSVPEYLVQPDEVASLFEARLDGLLDPEARRVEARRFGVEVWPVPYYPVCGEKIWGATAMILSEFLRAIGNGGGCRITSRTWEAEM